MKRKRAMRLVALFLVTVFFCRNAYPQNRDEMTMKENRKQATLLLIPAALITYGSLSHFLTPLQELNTDIRKGVQSINTGNTGIDDKVQYLPVAGFVALEVSRLEARGDRAERLIALLLAHGFMGTSVLCVKDNFRKLRPDLSSFNTFPSGHTATAFVAAELLRHYYWDSTPLCGIAAYAVAASVGFARIYNDRHWFGDVLAGAGVGIISARLAILFAPYLKQLLSERLKLFRKADLTAGIAPFANSKSIGLSLNLQF